VTEPRDQASDRAASGIAEYHATIAIYPERGVLEPQPAFESWTTFVSHRAVRAIAVAQESRIVWIASWGGVLAWNRTDEHVYRRYSSEHGLAGAPSCIAMSDDDRPWVGHAEGGLSWFDAGRWYPYEHLRDAPILAIAAASGGRMWIATSDAIAMVERGQRPVELVRGNASCAEPTALLGDADGVLVGSPSGLFRVSERSPVRRVSGGAISECTALARAPDGAVVAGTPTGVVIGDSRITPASGDAAIVGVAPSRRGIWVLTPVGIARIENNAWRAVAPASDTQTSPRALAVARPNDDYVWVGTDDLVSGLRPGGDTPWDSGVLPHHAEDVLSNLGRCGRADTVGRVWIGTGGGLFMAHPDGKWSFDEDLGDVRSVMPSGGGVFGPEYIWVLSWPAGLHRIAMPSRVLEPIALPPGLPRSLVSAYEPRAFAWVGDTLWHFDDGTAHAEVGHVPPDAHIVAQAPGRQWFVATNHGLFTYDPVRGDWSLVPAFGVAPVTALATIVVWLFAGTHGAFWMLDLRGWRKLELRHAGVAWTEPVTALARASDYETIWVACGGRVARCTTEDGTVLEVYDRFDSGVCGDVITAIIETDGVLWVVSRAGIARHTLHR
jgi:ligand-binding sensor domain-containing protein